MNACEKFQSATVELAGSGPIKQRLIGAYVHHLDEVTEEHVPKEVREEFCELRRAMRAVNPLRGEDPVRATVRKMSDGEAQRYALQIVNLFCTLSRSQRPMAMPAAVANTSSASVVQLYAAEG